MALSRLRAARVKSTAKRRHLVQEAFAISNVLLFFYLPVPSCSPLPDPHPFETYVSFSLSLPGPGEGDGATGVQSVQ